METVFSVMKVWERAKFSRPVISKPRYSDGQDRLGVPCIFFISCVVVYSGRCCNIEYNIVFVSPLPQNIHFPGKIGIVSSSSSSASSSLPASCLAVVYYHYVFICYIFVKASSHLTLSVYESVLTLLPGMSYIVLLYAACCLFIMIESLPTVCISQSLIAASLYWLFYSP